MKGETMNRSAALPDTPGYGDSRTRRVRDLCPPCAAGDHGSHPASDRCRATVAPPPNDHVCKCRVAPAIDVDESELPF